MAVGVRNAWVSLRGVWLRLVGSAAWVRGVVLPLAAVAIWNAITTLLGYRFNTAMGFVVANLVVAYLGHLIVQRSRLWGLRDVLKSLGDISDIAIGPGRQFFLDLTVARTTDTRRVIEGLANGTYRAETTELLQEWFDTFFTKGGTTYTGMDSHLPSKYLKDYGWYLDLHEKKLEGGGRSEHVRIVAATKNDLTADFLTDPTSFQRFREWHDDNDVTVKCIDPARIAALRADYSIGRADIGLWDNYAVLFTRDADGPGVSLAMAFEGDPRPPVSYEQISDFMTAVEDLAEVLDETPGLEMGDAGLAAEWIKYVDPRRRCDPDGPLAHFLLSQLSGRRLVLDAAGGIGCDSVFLMQNGFSVVTNEIDERLAEEGQRYAEQHGMTLELKRALWERLPSMLHGGMKFDAALVLGNSLCLVDEEKRRRQALAAFYEVLHPGGILIIDERNFEFLRAGRDRILEDPVEAFPSTVAGDVMYCGRELRAYPSEIDDASVSWTFFRNDPPVANTAELMERGGAFPALRLHAFAHGELYAALRATGFVDVEVFADYQSITNGAGTTMPSSEAIGDAAFITYIARRPA